MPVSIPYPIANGALGDGAQMQANLVALQNAINAGASTTGTPGYASRTAVAALVFPSVNQIALLAETGRAGIFVFNSANLSTFVTADTQQAVYIAPAADTTGATGAWVRRFDGPLNIKWFGATGAGAPTDDSGAFRALNTFCTIKNSTGFVGGRAVFLPFGEYYIASTVQMDAPCKFTGELGGGSFEYNRPTRITFPAGVTAFDMVRGAVNYADNATFTDIAVQGLSKNTNTGTGAITNGSQTLTLAAAGDFQNGQVILVRGAAGSGIFRKGIKAATTAGSPLITQSVVGGAGVYPGMILSVANAGFPANTYVVSATNNVITMSANATATVSGQLTTVYGDLMGMIISGGGTTTLTISAIAQNTVSGAQVIHADCGIFARTTVNLERVEFIGSKVGMALVAGGNYTQPSGRATNANAASWNKVQAHGCGIGVFIQGSDVNACTLNSVYTYSNDEYCIVEQSFLGNAWFGTHTSGGLGILHVVANSASLFDYAYTEGGTVNSFGALASGSGLQSGDEDGGLRHIPGGGYMGMPPSRVYPISADNGYQMIIGERNGNYGPIYTSNAAGSSQINLFGYSAGAYSFYDVAANKYPFAYTDVGYSIGAGHLLAPHGIQIGNDTASLAAGNFIRMIAGTAIPVTGTWKQGDTVKNKSAAVGSPKGWVCTVAGTPGTWVSEGNL